MNLVTKYLLLFRDDEMGNICQTDNLLIKYGKELYSGSEQNPIQVMKPMMLIGNILQKYQEASFNMSTSVDEMLHTKNWRRESLLSWPQQLKTTT